MSLTRLPQSTVRLLGSSQVITSVSSVVKELMENAFDAGASNIEVRLEKHGLDKIEVRDDGCGIITEDGLCMALPHYTSKISDFSDLESVQSYGFRGEALYSLCSLASVNVITRTADDEMARSYLFDNTGNVIESKISHGLQGTTVIVIGLFKNIPVRRQVMSSGKRVSDELKKVENIVKSLAVIHPRVRVSLAHNKFLIWQKTSVGHLRLSVMQILNHTITRQLHHIVCNTEQIKIELLIPKKDCDIQTVSIGALIDTFRLFINKRPVRDKKVEKIFSDIFFSYFGLYMPPSKFPVCFVALTVSPGMLDVNLEPNKTKIFIKDQDKLLEYLKEQLNLYYCDSFEEEKGVENCLSYSKKRKAEPLPSKKACKNVKSPPETLETDAKISATFSCTDEFKMKPCDNNTSNRYDLFENSNCGHSSETNRENVCDQLYNESVVRNAEMFPEINGGNIDMEDNINGADLNNLSGKSYDSMTLSLDPGMVNSYSTSSNGELSQGNALMGTDILPTSVESMSSKSSLSEKCDSNEELSLSQWSRGNIVSNENKMQASSVLLKPCVASRRENRIADSLTDDCKKDLEFVDTQETPSNSNNVIDEIEKFLDSEEVDLLLQRVTSSDTSDSSNKKSSNISEKIISESKNSENFLVTGVSTKKEESHVNVNNSLNRSVSSQMGKKEMSSFTKFAREMRSEILKESPGMSFTLVASTLASKWKNLQAEEREKYEKISNDERTKRKEIIKSPVKSCSPKIPKMIQRHSVCVNVVMDFDLEEYFERYTNNTIRVNNFEIVGQIESSDLWIYKRLYGDKLDVGVLSLSRLQEAYMFHQNMETMSIPVKNLEKSIYFNESDLGSRLWNVLINLEFNFDENTKMRSIFDRRIVMNGFRVQLEEDATGVVCAVLIDVAMNINFYGLEDLRETLNIIGSHGKDCCIAQSRCLNAIKYIRGETIRQCSFSTFTLPQKSDVLKLLNLWWSECKNFCKCNFGKDVTMSIHNIGC